MAIASISQHWADGSYVDLIVDSDDNASHPDLLDEIVRRVLDLYRATCMDGDT